LGPFDSNICLFKAFYHNNQFKQCFEAVFHPLSMVPIEGSNTKRWKRKMKMKEQGMLGQGSRMPIFFHSMFMCFQIVSFHLKKEGLGLQSFKNYDLAPCISK
jgi:hypothetical protein